MPRSRWQCSNRRGVDPLEYAVLTATVGLLHFRMNDPTQGSALYESSIEYFAGKTDYSHLSRVYYFYGIEMLRYDTDKGLHLLREAESIAKKHAIKDVLFIMERNKEVISADKNKR